MYSHLVSNKPRKIEGEFWVDAVTSMVTVPEANRLFSDHWVHILSAFVIGISSFEGSYKKRLGYRAGQG